jgi:DDE superfamily endonuclease
MSSIEHEISPKNKRRRKSQYSGRRKKHTVKTQLMVNTEGLILHETGCEGVRKHDYDIYKHNHPITPSQVENIVDFGYLGNEKDLPTVKSVPPIRKNTLALGSMYNKKRFILRIIVEHKICKIKKFGTMWTKVRNQSRRYNNVSDIISGLLNF